jgi:hypothetical protein
VRKIPTLFVRDFEHDPRNLTREVTPGCEWVIAGEGTPTRKYDGTCVMFDGTVWWARREVKEGKMPPSGFVPLGTDEETGKTVGWEPVERSSFAKWHAEAAADDDGHGWDLGTYELVGPKVNGNPENAPSHMLLMHEDAQILDDAPRDFDSLAVWLHARDYEGIVWHGGPDGRMAKIKKRDFRAP